MPGEIPIEKMWTEYAPIYRALFSDRDFEGQMNYLVSVADISSGSRVLELFAGPAFHGRVLLDQGFEVTSLDQSSWMRDIALVPSDRYIVAKLPLGLNAIAANEKFDACLALFFSLPFLEDIEVESLIRVIKEQLKPGGRILLELHEMRAPLAHPETTEIGSLGRKHVGLISGHLGTAVFESQVVEHKNGYAYVVNIIDVNTVHDHLRFVSRERVYTVQDIETLAAHIGGLRFECIPTNPELFPDALLVLLTKM